MTGFDLPRRLVAEGLGTAVLLAAVVGAALAAPLFRWLEAGDSITGA